MGRAANGHARLLPARAHPGPPRRRTPLMRENPATAGGWRLLRGAVVGGVAAALGVGGHWLADGAAPKWTTVVFLAMLLATVATWLSHARWTFARLLTLFLVTQAGVHVVLVGTQPVAHAANLHHTAEPTATLLPSDPSMLTGHAVAAVLTALLLHRGEAWLGGVLDALALRAVRLLDGLGDGSGVRPQPLQVGVLDRPLRHAGAGIHRVRGPPR